jgi:hypothetical protein
VAKAVPQTDALLLLPNKVAGGAEGKVANNAGIKIRPPPPTMESTKPANNEASETMNISIKKSAACATLIKSYISFWMLMFE